MPGQKKYAFLGLLTLLVCILALYIHRHRDGQTGKIDNILIGTSGYFQNAVRFMGQGVYRIGDHYLFLVNAKIKSEEAEKEIGLLQARLAQLEEVEGENQRLRQALGFHSQISEKLIPAHVVAHDVSTDYFGLRIDRGIEHGVKVGMGVISNSGVVGKILRTSARYSDVLTVLDPTSNVDVVIQRSRARGILSGQSKQLQCKLKYVDRLEDVAINDTVVASGFNSVFPKGLLVGHILEAVSTPSGILQNITVKSAVDMYRLEEVFVVVPHAESEKTS